MADRLVGDPNLTNMDLFRSEEMSLVQLIIPAESARETIANLGELGLLQFKDVSVLLHTTLSFSLGFYCSVQRNDYLYFRFCLITIVLQQRTED